MLDTVYQVGILDILEDNHILMDPEKTVQELGDEHYRAEQELAVDKFAERDANDLWDALHPI